MSARGRNIAAAEALSRPDRPERAGTVGPMKGRGTGEATVVTLLTTLSSTNTSDSDRYTVPGDRDLLIYSIRAFIALNEQDQETLSIVNGSDNSLGIGNVTLDERTLMKAMNTRANLQYETKRGFRIFDQNDLPLSAIMSGSHGGQPLVFRRPLELRSGDVIKMSLALKDTGVTGVIGGETDCGIVMEAELVPCR